MGKKQPAKLTPVTSQATYPTLIEARRDGGLLLKGLAAAVLATGLAGCGQSTATSGVPARDGGDAAPVDATVSYEVSGTSDLGVPDRSTAPEVGGIGGAIDVAGLYDSPIKDATDPSDTPSEPDAAIRVDAPDAARPDLRNPVTWVDGGPSDVGPWLGQDARDSATETRSPDASADSESDVK
jgi:hypothetical protein